MAISIHDLKTKHNADKPPQYLDLYSKYLTDMRGSARAVLELGVQSGGSLKMWREFFPEATVIGVDIEDCRHLFDDKSIIFFQGRQEDPSLFAHIFRSTHIDKFDVIVDDASHFGLYAKKSFDLLFDDHLSPGGFYIIEDWGTGYWADWPDGVDYSAPEPEKEDAGQKNEKFAYRPDEATGLLPKEFRSHLGGMVGFVKQLVDEAHRGAIKSLHPWRLSKFESMIVGEGVVLIQKKSP
jgi:hypothetical protein